MRCFQSPMAVDTSSEWNWPMYPSSGAYLVTNTLTCAYSRLLTAFNHFVTQLTLDCYPSVICSTYRVLAHFPSAEEPALNPALRTRFVEPSRDPYKSSHFSYQPRNPVGSITTGSNKKATTVIAPVSPQAQPGYPRRRTRVLPQSQTHTRGQGQMSRP